MLVFSVTMTADAETPECHSHLNHFILYFPTNQTQVTPAIEERVHSMSLKLRCFNISMTANVAAESEAPITSTDVQV